MGPFGAQEMILIFILALLLFGPKKLPELARMLGKGLSEFRRAKNELKSTFDTHMQELEREARVEELKKNPASTPPATTYNPYSYAADEYGKLPSDYGYNGGDSSYPAEPTVESHASNGTAPSETPALSAAPAVPGTVPRSSATSGETPANPGKDEHPA